MSHLQYQFDGFKMSLFGMIAETEFLTVKAYDDKKDVETSQLH